MARPEDVLSETAYTNYRNVRAVALLFIILGSILCLAGISLVAGNERQNTDQIHPLLALPLVAVGLAGAVGGVATRRGSRQWAPLVKVMAWLYLFAFPIGTILSYTLLSGLPKYLKSIDRIREAEDEDEYWDDEEDD